MPNVLPMKKGDVSVEWLVKFAGASLGVLYATGLVVTSVRFATLGVLNVEFVKPLYILTGAWAFLPATVGVALTSLFVKVSEEWPSPHLDGGLKRWLKGAWHLSKVIIGCVTGLAVLVMIGVAITTGMRFGEGFIVYFFWGVLLGAPVLLLTWHCFSDGISLRPGAAIGLLYFGASYFLVFSLFTFPAIPVALGGGGTRVFALTIANDKVKTAIIGRSAADESPVITSVLAETSSHLIVPAAEAVNGVSPHVGPGLSDAELWRKQYSSGRGVVLIPKSDIIVSTVLEPEHGNADMMLLLFGGKKSDYERKGHSLSSSPTATP